MEAKRFKLPVFSKHHETETFEHSYESSTCRIYDLMLIVVTIVLRFLFNGAMYTPGIMVPKLVDTFEHASKALINSIASIQMGTALFGCKY